jgi:hypothetical protein
MLRFGTQFPPTRKEKGNEHQGERTKKDVAQEPEQADLDLNDNKQNPEQQECEHHKTIVCPETFHNVERQN